MANHKNRQRGPNRPAPYVLLRDEEGTLHASRPDTFNRNSSLQVPGVGVPFCGPVREVPAVFYRAREDMPVAVRRDDERFLPTCGTCLAQIVSRLHPGGPGAD